MPMQQPSRTPEAAPACSGTIHTVAAGDTLYMLARTYNVTLDALMKANPTLDPYNLRIGMQLCIPAQEEGMNNNNMNGTPGNMGYTAGGSRVYATQRGDTLTRILDRYEISFGALQSSNPNVDFAGPLENMTLTIPSEDHFKTCPMAGAYIVKTGDSLDSISKKLLVITDGLLISNPTLTIEDFSIPGTKVCIPS